jgi:hypothetical protein
MHLAASRAGAGSAHAQSGCRSTGTPSPGGLISATQNHYLDLLQQTAEQALDLMEQRLQDRAATGQTINSLRELYNLWVECNEETYARMLRSVEYSELSGRLLNALLHLLPTPRGCKP